MVHISKGRAVKVTRGNASADTVSEELAVIRKQKSYITDNRMRICEKVDVHVVDVVGEARGESTRQLIVRHLAI